MLLFLHLDSLSRCAVASSSHLSFWLHLPSESSTDCRSVCVCVGGGGDGGLREMVTRGNVAGDSSHPWFFPRSVFPMLISCPTSGRERRAYTPISRWFRPLTNWFEKPSKTGHQRWTRTASGGWKRRCYESARRRRACWT